jgi:signal transduction histidine kinase
MLIQQIWDVFVLALCLIAVGVAFLIVYTNRQRSLNRFLTCFLLALSSSQILQLLWLNSGRLKYLRASHVFIALAFAAAALIHDAVLYPSSSLILRIKRKSYFLIPISIIAIFPLTNWWLMDHHHSEIMGLRLVFLSYLSIRAALAFLLFVMAISSWPRVPAERRFDTQSLIILTSFLFAGIMLAFMARLLVTPNALRWIEAIVGAYYPLVAWMMTSPRLYSAIELGKICLRILLCILFPLAVVLPLLSFAGRLPVFCVAVALAVSGYPVMLLGNLIAKYILDYFANSSRDDAKAAMNALVSSEWSESRLRERLCQIVSTFMSGVPVEAVSLESLLENRLSPARSLLVREAARTGCLTIHSAQRQTKADMTDAVQQAFLKEKLGLVLVSKYLDNYCVLFVGQFSSLKIITHPTIAFLSDLLLIFHSERHRISLAHKAIYNDRLAAIGFIASQVSHEARNRLDSIRVALELLKAGKESELTPEHRSLLLEELEIFLMDFTIGLDMARTDIGQIAEASACSVIDEAVTLFIAYARNFGIHIETEFKHESDEVLVDRRLLRQALFNLFRNAADALKSTPDPRIVLQTSSSSREFLIDVVDNGPGVASDQYDRLFIEFNTTKETGTGLGLSLCRDIMALMRGSIRYLTPKGVPHASFRLAMPLAIRPEPTGSLLSPVVAEA